MMTEIEMNYHGLIRCPISTTKLVQKYRRAVRLLMIPMIAYGDAGGRSLFSIFILLLFFKFRLARLVSLVRCICSVASSTFLLSKGISVDSFPLLLEFRESSEDMN